MKKCIKCKKQLDELCFHKNKSKKDGLTNICKSCIAEYNKEWVCKNRGRVNDNQRILKLKHAENGLCRHCNNVALSGSQMCEKHWFQDISRKQFKTIKHWEFLKDLWVNQSKKCVYTDEILIPGINMSLDHIISKYNDILLSEELTNVQWVTKDINMIKNKLSHDEFIDLCEKIYKKFRNNADGIVGFQACGDEGLPLSAKQEAHPIGYAVGG